MEKTKKEILSEVCSPPGLPEAFEPNDDITVSEALEAMQIYAEQERKKAAWEAWQKQNERHESVTGMGVNESINQYEFENWYKNKGNNE